MIQIDTDVFAFQPERDMSNERFVVTDVQEAEPVIAALNRASERFMEVDTNGVEHSTEESMQVAVDAGADSPSYVSDPEVTDRGIEVYLDCKGVIGDTMAATLREILFEELSAARYAGTVSAVTVEG